MSRRISTLFGAIVFGLLIAAGALALQLGGNGDAVPVPQTALIEPAAAAAPSAPAPSSPAPVAARAPKRERSATPVRVQIPSIGVDAPVIKLGLEADGELEVPTNFGDTGWWTGGARPGEAGPAVIAGHVDSKTGPAVFYRLRELRQGDAIIVTGRDGSRVRFTVQRSASYEKDQFPSHAVYGPTGKPALRLITCSGSFDRSSGHYLDNTVVYAA